MKPRFDRGSTEVRPRLTAVFVRLFLDSTVLLLSVGSSHQSQSFHSRFIKKLILKGRKM